MKWQKDKCIRRGSSWKPPLTLSLTKFPTEDGTGITSCSISALIVPFLIELLHVAYVFDNIIQYVNTSNVGLHHFKQPLNFAAADLTCTLENVAAPTCLLELETEEKQSVAIQTERGHPRVNLLSPHLHCRLDLLGRRSCREDTVGAFSPCPYAVIKSTKSCCHFLSPNHSWQRERNVNKN